MWIRNFCKFIEVECLREHSLQNCAVIIDGQNFFYRQYHSSGLQYVFGCESDKYADYLRDKLQMFKGANVKCYIIFKGGHEDLQKRLSDNKTNWLSGTDFVIGENQDHTNIVYPVFKKEVYQQVLVEMGIDYTYCKFESKMECMAFAKKHNWPVISFDVEYCFAGVDYIPYNSLKFNPLTNSIECGLFTLKSFLQEYQLTEDKLAIFAALTDGKKFPENHFCDFFRTLRIHLGYYKRINGLLSWLAATSRDDALARIFRFTTSKEEAKFKEVVSKVRDLERCKGTPGLPSEYLDNGNIEVTMNDPQWFEKGIALKHVPAAVVNLYHYGIILGSTAIADKEDEDAILPSMEIIKYIYNLLTNFEKEEITLLTKGKSIIINVTGGSSIPKPDYVAICSPFENGWGRLPTGLFQHFFSETLKGFNFDGLESLPDDVKLLIMALVYYSRKKTVDTSIVCGVILSYAALSMLRGTSIRKDNSPTKLTPKPILDPTTYKDKVTDSDKLIAKVLLMEYQTDVTETGAISIFDPQMVQPLAEFQHCLAYLNYLNQLCGSPFKPTIYSETYNGTFVYKVVREIRSKYGSNALGFLKSKLSPAATVLAFVSGLMELFEELLY